MHSPDVFFEYRLVQSDQIGLVRPLWEKHKAHNAKISPPFSSEILARRFEERRAELFHEDKEVHILLVYIPTAEQAIGYCITSFSSHKAGVIESLFVDEPYRGSGIGSELMKRSLEWLDKRGVLTKSVTALFGNDGALRFYARFGFYQRSIKLIQLST